MNIQCKVRYSFQPKLSYCYYVSIIPKSRSKKWKEHIGNCRAVVTAIKALRWQGWHTVYSQALLSSCTRPLSDCCSVTFTILQVCIICLQLIDLLIIYFNYGINFIGITKESFVSRMHINYSFFLHRWDSNTWQWLLWSIYCTREMIS